MNKNEVYNQITSKISTNYSIMAEHEHALIHLSIDAELLASKLVQLMEQESSSREKITKLKKELKEKREAICEHNDTIEHYRINNEELVGNLARLSESGQGTEPLPDYYSIKIEDLGLEKRLYNHLTRSGWYWEGYYDVEEKFECVGDIIQHLIEQKISYDNKYYLNFDNTYLRLTEEKAAAICRKLEEFGYHHENIDIILKRHEIWHLGFDHALIRTLITAGLITKRQLSRKPVDELYKIPGIGKTRVAQIRAAIQQ